MRKILFAALLLTCQQNLHAQKFEQKGNVVIYRSNKFEYSRKGIKDVQTVTDPVSGRKVKKTTTKDPVPVKMNGTRIYNFSEAAIQPVAENGSFEMYVLKGLSNEFSKLADGDYYMGIYDVIIDQKGKVVFYQNGGLSGNSSKIRVPADIQQAIDRKLDTVIGLAPVFKPGMAQGKPAIILTDINLTKFIVQVKNHKANITRDF